MDQIELVEPFNGAEPLPKKKLTHKEIGEIVKKMKPLRAEGKGSREITLALNEMGFRKASRELITEKTVELYIRKYLPKNLRKISTIPPMTQQPVQQSLPIINPPPNAEEKKKRFLNYVIETELLTKEQKLDVLKVLV